MENWIRKIDDLGRITIPKEIVKRIGVAAGTEMESFIKYGDIYIRKFEANHLKKSEYTGIVRRLDDLGRLTFPKEYLNVLDIQPKDAMEIHFLEDNSIKVVKIN